MDFIPAHLKYFRQGLLVSGIALVALAIGANFLEPIGVQLSENATIVYLVCIFVLMHIVAMLIAPLMCNLVLKKFIDRNRDIVGQSKFSSRWYGIILKNRNTILSLFSIGFWLIAILGILMNMQIFIHDAKSVVL